MLLEWLAIRNPLLNAHELRIFLTLIYSREELYPESFRLSSFLDHAELRFVLFASLDRLVFAAVCLVCGTQKLKHDNLEEQYRALWSMYLQLCETASDR